MIPRMVWVRVGAMDGRSKKAFPEKEIEDVSLRARASEHESVSVAGSEM